MIKNVNYGGEMKEMIDMKEAQVEERNFETLSDDFTDTGSEEDEGELIR